MISNQETEPVFCEFVKGLIELAEEMEIDFEPLFVMMDACEACFNAVTKMLPDAEILMCFFHVMKNVKSNCEKPLSKEQYVKFRYDIGLIHYSVSKADFDEKVKNFEKEWNKKGTKNVFEYMNKQWFTGKFSSWQVFTNPPGWANTNSNIESFNATIKRDHSLRRRYSVYGSVDVIIQMIEYYSTHKKTFYTIPKFDKKTKSWGKHCAVFKYKKVGRQTYSYKNKYEINTKTNSCNCSAFLKNAVCPHILGYIYRHPSLDEQCLFGERYQNKAVDFHHKMKRGAEKKNTGRYKNAEKALSSY